MMSGKVFEARQEIVRLKLRLAEISEDRKACKTDLKLAELRFFKLIDDEAAGVQDLPLGEPDDDDALNRRLEELSAEANGEPAWLKDTFAALTLVGHTDEQARAMLDRAMASGQHFKSNRDVIDWIYKDHKFSQITPEADALAEHEQDEPERHGQPVEDDDDGPLLPERSEGWDIVTSRLLTPDQEAEADALAKIEADAAADKPKRRRKAKAQ